MPIDRIGKGGGPIEPPKTAEVGGPARPAEVEKPFSIERAEKGAPSREVQGVGTTPLERLRAGEIDVNGYVDLKVDEATAHLHGLPASKLESIKSMLRDQMRTDPALLDLVKSATGSVPTPHEE